MPKKKQITKKYLDNVSENRLLSKVVVDKNTDCWNWQGKPVKSSNKIGYGRIKVLKKEFYVHCFSYAKFVGENPNNLLVCHTCDNGMCINPKHLFLGTPQDNMTDKVRKNRQSKGLKHRSSIKNIKLSLENIQDIKHQRKQGKKLVEIASKYNVSFQHISDIVNNKKCLIER